MIEREKPPIEPLKIVRDMPDYMKKHPDRDYSVNRAERRKARKTHGNFRNDRFSDSNRNHCCRIYAEGINDKGRAKTS